MPQRKRKREYWYRFYIGECPICGRSKSYKERVYVDVEPRPLDITNRYVYLPEIETYDYCDAL